MITSRRSSLGSAGSMRSASARLVSGPTAIPTSSPGYACAARTQASAASCAVSWRSVDGNCGITQALRAVGVLCGAQRRADRLLGSPWTPGCRCSAQLEQTEVVAANLLYGNISRGRRDADQVGVVAGEQVHQRHRVVDARVDVGEDRQRRRPSPPTLTPPTIGPSALPVHAGHQAHRPFDRAAAPAATRPARARALGSPGRALRLPDSAGVAPRGPPPSRDSRGRAGAARAATASG